MIKFTYQQLKELKTNLGRVLCKDSVPFMQNIYCEIFTKGFTLCARNSTEMLLCPSHEGGGEPTSFLISPETMKRIFAGMKRGSSVLLIPDGEELKVTYLGYAEMTLSFPLLSAEEYPEFSSLEGESVIVDLDKFIGQYRKAQTMASQDPSRLSLNSVLFDSETDTVVATDGRRVFSADSELCLEQDVLFPITKTLKSSKIFKGEGELRVDGEYLEITTDDYVYQTKQVEGSFPNWRAVEMKSHSHSVDFSKADIHRLIELVTQLRSPNKDHSIELVFHDEKVILVAEDDNGVRSAIVDAVEYTADTPRLSLNPTFLIDALKAIDSPRLYIEEANAPVAFLSEDVEITVMPMKVPVSAKIAHHLSEQHGLESPGVKTVESPKPFTKLEPPKPKEEKKMSQVTETPKVVETTDPLEEIYATIEAITEKQNEARAKTDEANKLLRDAQQGIKSLIRQVKAYDKQNTKKLKDFHHAQELIGKLQLAVAS